MNKSLGDELARRCVQWDEADPGNKEAVAPPRTEQYDDREVNEENKR